MRFDGIHFAKPHAITHRPLCDKQMLCYLFEPARVRFGAEFASFRFSCYGWCGTFKTHGKREWIVIYLGKGRSKITPYSKDNHPRCYFEDFDAALARPSMKEAYGEYQKKALLLGSEPLPTQPYEFSARRIFRYLWLPVINNIAGPRQKWVTSFQFSAENWCARFVLGNKIKGAIIYRGNKSYRTILGLTDSLFERIGIIFNATEELPS